MTVYNSLWLCTSINAPSSSLPKKRKNKKIENAYQWSVLYYIQFLNAVTWLKGIRDVAESGRSCVEMDGDSYRFVLKKANYGDGGTYIVKASNCHGSQKAYCTVRVSYRVDHPSLLLSSSLLLFSFSHSLAFCEQVKETVNSSEWDFKDSATMQHSDASSDCRVRRFNKGKNILL